MNGPANQPMQRTGLRPAAERQVVIRTHSNMERVEYIVDPPVQSERLNELFSATWPEHAHRDFAPVLSRSLGYVCAFSGELLIGFVNIAWDGGCHAFLLDPTVHPEFQKRGIGSELVRRSAAIAKARRAEWLHVDYAPELEGFYVECGFRPTSAGLIKLDEQVAG